MGTSVYTYAYGKAGAVQCGFYIPGMVMCTKALLDENMEPTDDEIRYALRNNYCRCTGYVKIMDAVRLAAKILKKGEIPDDGDPNWTIGNRVARIDVAEKVLGTGKYPDDFISMECCTALLFEADMPVQEYFLLIHPKQKNFREWRQL